uniref:Uncharacterized protein n=1 Tax=Sphaerodactylus townsendi TaxID=933632 RepID=A0ACB8EDU1_9SAUR
MCAEACSQNSVYVLIAAVWPDSIKRKMPKGFGSHAVGRGSLEPHKDFIEQGPCTRSIPLVGMRICEEVLWNTLTELTFDNGTLSVFFCSRYEQRSLLFFFLT